MLRLITLFFLATIHLSAHADSSTYDLLRDGKSCSNDPRTQDFACEYKIGLDFYVAIHRIGTTETTIAFYKSDIGGHYHASYSFLSECISVSPGHINQTKDEYPNYLAFISPFNGKVYKTVESCNARQ